MTVRKAISASVLVVTAFAFAAQFLIDFTPDNIACASVILISSLSIILYINCTDAISTNPLSTFAIFGFCVTTQLGALIAQSAMGSSVSASLRQPLYTFGVLAFYQAIAIFVHATYRVFSAPRYTKLTLLRKLLKRAGLYATPDSGQLWCMGFIGCAAIIFHGGEGVLTKVGDAFIFLTWAPFLIPFYLRVRGQSYCNAKRATLSLFLYTCFIAMLGMAV